MQTVLVANAHVIEKFLRKNRDVAKWIGVWIAIAEEAHWTSLHDVRKDYPSADGVFMSDKSVVTVFNIKGHLYRLLTKIDYTLQAVWIIEILTHAEYSKNKWKA